MIVLMIYLTIITVFLFIVTVSWLARRDIMEAIFDAQELMMGVVRMLSMDPI